MLDSLTVIRRLKELGIEIWFEKEATRTLDSKGDVSHRKLIQFGKSDPPLKGLK